MQFLTIDKVTQEEGVKHAYVPYDIVRTLAEAFQSNIYYY